MLRFSPVFTLTTFTLLPLFFSTFTPPSFAQSSGNFNKQQCIQSLVKEGLKNADASVWCNYKEQCIVRSQKEGLPADAAKSVCDCSIKEFRKRYSTQKFREISKQADSNPKISRELREVGEKCFEDILYE